MDAHGIGHMIQQFLKVTGVMVFPFTIKIKNNPHFNCYLKQNFPCHVLLLPEVGVATRADHQRKLIEVGHTRKTMQSLVGDDSRVWNKAHTEIKNSETLSPAKKAIKVHCKTNFYTTMVESGRIKQN